MKSNKIENQTFFYTIPVIGTILTALVYLPTVHYGFLFDDVPNIMKFYDIRYATFRDLFFSRSRWLSAWLNTIHYSIGKFDTFSYRLFNICMHALSGILVFLIFLLALRTREQRSFFYQNRISLAAITSMFFMLHPVQTQTISYVIQGQLEGLAGFFILSMVLVFLLMNQVQAWINYLALCILLFTLALFSVGTKEIAIISPLILLLVDWFFVAKGDVGKLQSRLLLHTMIALVVWGGYVYLLKPEYFANIFGFKLRAQNNLGNQLTENHKDGITPLHYFISQFKVILHYIWIFMWPFNISIDYDEKLVSSFFAFDCFAPLLILLSIFGGVLKALKKDKLNLIAFSILWFFIAIIPRSSIIPASELIADYKTYIASVGVLFIFACSFVWVTRKLTRDQISHILAASLLAILLACATHHRNKVWQSGKALWANVIQNAPKRARAYNNYATALMREKNFEDAVPYLKKAFELDNHYPDALCNLAIAYNNLDQPNEALKAIYHALELRKSPENFVNLASVYLKLSRYQEAVEACQQAIEKYRIMKNCEYGKAWYSLGIAYSYLGEHIKAWQALKTACKKADMDNESGYLAFGKKSLEVKKYKNALWAFDKACDENDSPINLYYLGVAYLKNERFAEALKIFKHLVNNDPHNKMYINALQQAYTELESYKELLQKSG